MTTMLNKPNEDEILVGVLVDYVLEMGITEPHRFLHLTLGYQVSNIADLPGGLERVADETSVLWGLSASEIRGLYTTYNYLVASCSELVAHRVAAAMNREPSSPRNRCSLGFGRFVRPRVFLYCEICAAEDRMANRRPYCRRAHQLPGVVICYKHGCLLHQSPVLTRRPFEAALQNRGICREGVQLDFVDASPARLDIMKQVAVNSFKILNSACQGKFYQNRERYREELEIRGYSLGDSLVQLDKLSADLVETFGASYLESIGLYRKGQGTRDWLVPLLCKGQAVPPTISHVFLQTFLELVDAGTSAGTVGADHAPNVRCPAIDLPYVASDIEHKILRARVADRRGWAVCSCDTAFRFVISDCQQRVDRIVRLGKPYKQYAQQLEANGLGEKEIARKLSVSTMSVRRMLSKGRSQPRNVGAETIEGRRAAWQAVFENGCASLANARREHRKLYRSLLADDRIWVDQFSHKYRVSPTKRVDWPARDAEYLPLLQAAAKELSEASPPRWVSTISVLFIAGVKLGTRNQLGKLPRCRQFLGKVVESSEEFRQRIKATRNMLSNPVLCRQ
jgi:hypothetical protein